MTIAEAKVLLFADPEKQTTVAPHDLLEANHKNGRLFLATQAAQQFSTFSLLEPWQVSRSVLCALAGVESKSTVPIVAVATASNPVIFENLFIVFLHCCWSSVRSPP